MGAIPIVNEKNDTISTYEIEFGDNDTLSAVVAALVEADLLILLSDIDGLFTDDPHQNPDARFIDVVEELDEKLLAMGKGTTGKRCGNRRYGNKTFRRKYCRYGWRRYGDRKRKRFPYHT